MKIINRARIRVPPGSLDARPRDQSPVVWRVDDETFVLVAGRRYLAARPDLDLVPCRVVEATTLEEAEAQVRIKPLGRPLLGRLKKLAERIRRLPDPTEAELAFLYALTYSTGESSDVQNWPPRIRDLTG